MDECGLITRSTAVLLPSLECQDCKRVEVRLYVHILTQSICQCPLSFRALWVRESTVLTHSQDGDGEWTGDAMLIVISPKISMVVPFSSLSSQGGW